jgi:hypothetical protein
MTSGITGLALFKTMAAGAQGADCGIISSLLCAFLQAHGTEHFLPIKMFINIGLSIKPQQDSEVS